MPARIYQLRAWGLLGLAALFWAGNIVLARAVSTSIAPVALSFWRWAVALVLLGALYWKPVYLNRHVLRREWRLIAALGISGMAVFHTTLYVAVGSTTAINAALIIAISPVVVPFFSSLLLKERLAPSQGLGIALSFLGVTVIVAGGEARTLLDAGPNRGDVEMLVAMLSWSLYTVLLKRRPADLPVEALLTAAVAVAVAALAPIQIWEIASGQAMVWTAQSVATVGYVALFASVVAFLAFNRGIDAVGPNQGAVTVHLIPVFATILAVAFLGETLHIYHAVGISAIVSGLFLPTLNRKRGTPAG